MRASVGTRPLARAFDRRRPVTLANTNVLVLNQNYEPLNVCNARRALVLVGVGKAEVVEEADAVLRTVARAFRIPSIIRMRYFIRRPRPLARLSRREVFARDRFVCQYCHKRSNELTLDHVLPRRQGGAHTWENLVSACRSCNHRKAGRTPQEARMRLRRRPVRPAATLHSLLAVHLDKRPNWRPFFPGLDRERRSEGAAAAGG